VSYNNYSLKTIRWWNTAFVVGVLALTFTATPLYLWHYGLDWFQVTLFLIFFAATGLSITMGYHRLFSHLSFQAHWPVRLFTLLFGAAAFENSALCWAADHRKHHKFVDHDNDPYNISNGFWHAHIGWILFRVQPETDFSGVKDLRRDPLVMWQHNHYNAIAGLAGLGIPALLGGLWNGWEGALGGFLIAGISRITCVQQMTFCINSLCHTLGRQPYSNRCTARDSGLMALLTFGEGFHNFHHEFQHDYRNGVKPWQFDPTKWSIWLLHQCGLIKELRRVPEGEILKAEVAEQQRQLTLKLRANAIQPSQPMHQMLQAAHDRFQHALADWECRKAAYRLAANQKMRASRERIAELRREFELAKKQLRQAVREWREVCRLAQVQYA
jgi:stearoyl-CoA desaturase (Delta-9 desaturase)